MSINFENRFPPKDTPPDQTSRTAGRQKRNAPEAGAWKNGKQGGESS
jgi:hypothetical protein